MTSIRMEHHIVTSRLAFETVAQSAGITTSIRKELESKAGRYPSGDWSVGSAPIVYRGFRVATGDYAVMLMSYVGKDYTRQRGNYLAHSYLINQNDLQTIDYNLPWLAAHLSIDDSFTSQSGGRIDTLEPLELELVPWLQLFKLAGFLMADQTQQGLARLLTQVLQCFTCASPPSPTAIAFRATSVTSQAAQSHYDLPADAPLDIMNLLRVAALFTLLPVAVRPLLNFAVNELEPSDRYDLTVLRTPTEPADAVETELGAYLNYCLGLVEAQNAQQLQTFHQWLEKVMAKPRYGILNPLVGCYRTVVKPVADNLILDEAAACFKSLAEAVATDAARATVIHPLPLIEAGLKVYELSRQKPDRTSNLDLLLDLALIVGDELSSELVLTRYRNLIELMLPLDDEPLAYYRFFQRLPGAVAGAVYLTAHDQKAPPALLAQIDWVANQRVELAADRRLATPALEAFRRHEYPQIRNTEQDPPRREARRLNLGPTSQLIDYLPAYLRALDKIYPELAETSQTELIADFTATFQEAYRQRSSSQPVRSAGDSRRLLLATIVQTPGFDESVVVSKYLRGLLERQKMARSGSSLIFEETMTEVAPQLSLACTLYMQDRMIGALVRFWRTLHKIAPIAPKTILFMPLEADPPALNRFLHQLRYSLPPDEVRFIASVFDVQIEFCQALSLRFPINDQKKPELGSYRTWVSDYYAQIRQSPDWYSLNESYNRFHANLREIIKSAPLEYAIVLARYYLEANPKNYELFRSIHKRIDNDWILLAQSLAKSSSPVFRLTTLSFYSCLAELIHFADRFKAKQAFLLSLRSSLSKMTEFDGSAQAVVSLIEDYYNDSNVIFRQNLQSKLL